MTAQKPLLPYKTAFLVANGVSENDFIAVQKKIQQLGGDTRIISVDQGLVTSWAANGWGLNFAADHALNTSLAADYDALVIPGGQRSIEKLQLTAHTRRFIRGFFETGKPVCVIGEGKALLTYAEIDASQSYDNVIIDTLDADKQAEQVEAIGEFFLNSLLSDDAIAA